MSKGSPLRILLVDESPGAEARVSDWICGDLPLAEVHQAPGEAALCEALAHCQFDVVITESRLSWTDGLGVLDAVRNARPEHPVLMLTEYGDEDLAVSALQAGFDAYLRKGPDQSGRLAAAVSAALKTADERAARRRAEQALFENEARHRVIVEGASDVIVTIDVHGIMESVNPAVMAVFGYEPRELIGKNVSMLMPSAIAVEHDGYLARYLETDEPHIIGIGRIVEGRRKDGAAVKIDLAVSEIRLGGRRLFTGMMRDIGERLRAEEERLLLLERERQAIAETRREATEKSLILQQMLDAVIVTDRDGRIVLVNAAAGQVLGVDSEQLVGLPIHRQSWQTLDEQGLPVALEDRPIIRALRGEQFSAVYRMKTADARDLVVRAASAPVRDETGQIAGAVHVVHDITDEVARERQVAQGAKLRALGQLAGGVAHDLNQYLGLVVGYGDLALQELERPALDLDSVQDSVHTMIRAAVDGAEAVRRLLLFARPDAEGTKSRVDLDDVLRQVAKLTAPRWRDAAQQEGRTIQVSLEVEGDVAIDGWPSDLREAFTNLLLNAVDALPDGGLIRLRAVTLASHVVVQVIDSGVGMTPETREKLFEPFFSTKGEGGSGLGLAIVFGIVERHDGSIAVRSELGEGTTFELVFPIAAQGEPARPPDERPDAVRPQTILVVDDEPALVTMLSRILESDGHTVLVAMSGEEALSLLATSSVDVVISDLGMGSGMNGWDLAAAVQQQPHPPQFILTTGWGAEIDPDEALERGVRAVIAKPYRLPDLRKVLQEL
ncbi:MAG: PAS domain S-box protein [Chloroflexi bacterium]|nr:PAS domain S-box protein [Chloroflexota bacterium]